MGVEGWCLESKTEVKWGQISLEMLNRWSNQQPWKCRCSSDAGVYRKKKEIPHHGRAADFFGGVVTYTTTELSSCDDCNLFCVLCI
ncbi:hypothetical protein TNCV_4536491 [Trichonephila clavipes]|nr:hypothetical protein TNCV_4536491 [Trichonephila clavipes]